MANYTQSPQSPLSIEDLQKIEATQLPLLDRHHLRLLAHSLECFKGIAPNSLAGPLPLEHERMKWCIQQSALVNEKAFISVLLDISLIFALADFVFAIFSQ